MNRQEIDALLEAAKNADAEKISVLGNDAAAKLSQEQKSKIEEIMQNPEYLKSVLSSPKARAIIEMLKGEEK